jgi:hypothetical protein
MIDYPSCGKTCEGIIVKATQEHLSVLSLLALILRKARIVNSSPLANEIRAACAPACGCCIKRLMALSTES